LNITKLDLPTKVNAILAAHKDGIEKAIAEDAEAGLTNKQSKAIGQCVTEIRYEIKRQGEIYVKEEETAIKFVTVAHQNTKAAADEAETLAKELKKRWDEGKGERIKEIARVTAETAAKVHDLKEALKNHTGFRGKYCSDVDCKALLGERNYNELNDYYIGLRAPTMQAFIDLTDKFPKIDEHVKRAALFVKLLPTLAKTQQEDSAAAEVAEDAAEVKKLRDLVDSEVPSKIDKLDDMLESFKLHKKKPCTPAFVKMCATTLKDHELKVKEQRSKVKTATMQYEAAVKKAGKEKDAKPHLKQMAAHVEEMEDHLKKWNKRIEEASKEQAKIAKLVGV